MKNMIIMQLIQLHTCFHGYQDAADSTASFFFSFWVGLGPLGPGPPRMKKKGCGWISCILVTMKQVCS